MKYPLPGWNSAALASSFILSGLFLSINCITVSMIQSAAHEMDTQAAHDYETEEAVTSTYNARDEYRSTETARASSQ